MSSVIVTGAGGGGGNNLIRSIRQGGYPVRILGANADAYALAQSLADVNYLLPRGDTGEAYLNALNCVIEAEDAALVVPNNDTEVTVVSRERDRLPIMTFLPAQHRRCRKQRVIDAGVDACKAVIFRTTPCACVIFVTS